MKIYIASDHAGFDLKTHLISYLESGGFEMIDCGPKEKVAGDDYPDWISKVAIEVSKNPDDTKGIVIGYSGQGEAIVANKFKNIRAGVYYGGPAEIITLLREHNNSNVLSLSAKLLTPAEASKAVDLWLNTAFSNDPRHIRRIQKIKDLESNV